MQAKLSFHGAVGGVTGSCHLLETGGLKLLVDCGLFQGDNQWRSRNQGDFGFDPASIDYLLLSHAHLDHCGRIPLLVKRGFRGKIICTRATYDIAKIILLDSARIQEEDVEHWRPANLRDGFKPKKPLYTTLDALDALGYFETFTKYDKPHKLGDAVKVTFRDAGHILGASFIEVDTKGGQRVLFSGDLGNTGKPIIRDPSFARKAEVVVVESTYGDRNHKSVDESVEELIGCVLKTFEAGGNVVIPSFAVERAQELLYFFRKFHEEGRLPRSDVFLDSPMATSVTNIMRRHPECFNEETLRLFNSNADPFSFPGLQITRTQTASKRINHAINNAVIIAGAGMCNGGRIRLHLQRNILRPECSIVFIGFQAKGTLGREIVDGAQEVSILGESYKVKANIHTIGGFSSHADKDTLIDWLAHGGRHSKVFVVHGENSAVSSLGSAIIERNLSDEAIVPELHKQYSLE
ncbi:MAG: MBL fold metallo-hydrolase [Thermodesulfovibrionales bacterium]|nr:MBL fold metallo-hydrolase [Thermodesulfovibrionales bacterium]